jgi:adenine-specific DNA-methyltransferase
VPEEFFEEIRNNKAQIQEWIDLYAIDDESIGGNDGLGFAEKWTNPPSVNFLKANKNLVIDTKHFSYEFKDRLIAGIDKLDEAVDGVMVHGDNSQVLDIIKQKYISNVDCIHIDPPYNTDTSGFLYKNNFRHSSWMSMISDKVIQSYNLLSDFGSFVCHIDENEYENLFHVIQQTPFINIGTIIWDKRNPMTGGHGIATQHEYIVWQSKSMITVSTNTNNSQQMLDKVKELIDKFGKVNDALRAEYITWLNNQIEFSGGDKAYRYIDDVGNVYQSVSLRAPEKRTDEKFFIPLIHPVTKKPCPVPPNGFSRTPETLADMIKKGEILFGKDETTQPRQKMFLTPTKSKQLTTVIQDATRGKSDLDKLGLYFSYNHSVSFYEGLLSNLPTDYNKTILDYFAGSGTTGHAVINLNRQDEGSRKYILVEMGEYFNTVTKPRMQKVIYAKDWKDGKPLSRTTGISHLMKYFRLESYEDTLTNIEFPNETIQKGFHFGEDYFLNYMLDAESKNSLLNIDSFKEPFNYQIKITEKNEIKNTPVDLVETFNYLLGLTIVRQGALRYFKAVKNGNKEYEGSVDLKPDTHGDYGFKQIEGRLADDRRVLVIWRNITGDAIASNAALDAYFLKNRINPADREYDLIYVNGDNTLENLRLESETWKVNIIEKEFLDKMFKEDINV